MDERGRAGGLRRLFRVELAWNRIAQFAAVFRPIQERDLKSDYNGTPLVTITAAFPNYC